MKNRLRSWLRSYFAIDDIVSNQQMLYNEHAGLHRKMSKQINQLDKLQEQMNAIGPGLGRVIAKLDPMYAEPELDNPARKAESDRIGEEALERLAAEAAARAPYNIISEDQ